jgi:hypothetical protein
MLFTVGVAAAAGAVAVYITGPNGSISCAPHPSANGPEPIPRWLIAAGAPALIGILVGAYFALGATSARWRLLGLLFAAAVAAATFYGVYTFLPAACRP